jgi:hypothetical protein
MSVTRVGRWIGGAACAMGAWCALSGTASAAEGVTSPVVPHTAGMMGAVDAPDAAPDTTAVPEVIQAGGALLLAGGALTAARSWVSTATPR